jgi:DNA-directed RNA polymerase sigma subunit (sigma70/sigma32)
MTFRPNASHMPSFTRCLDRRSLDNFLNKASSIPRLTLEDEIRLSNQLRAGLKYLGHNPDAIPQTTEERKIRDRAKYARERIIAANIMLVVSIAYKYQEAADVEDLISEGTIGLSKAAEKFDAAKGVYSLPMPIGGSDKRLAYTSSHAQL